MKTLIKIFSLGYCDFESADPKPLAQNFGIVQRVSQTMSHGALSFESCTSSVAPFLFPPRTQPNSSIRYVRGPMNFYTEGTLALTRSHFCKVQNCIEFPMKLITSEHPQKPWNQSFCTFSYSVDSYLTTLIQAFLKTVMRQLGSHCPLPKYRLSLAYLGHWYALDGGGRACGQGRTRLA